MADVEDSGNPALPTDIVPITRNQTALNVHAQEIADLATAVVQFLTDPSGNYTVPAGKYRLQGYMQAGGGGGGGVANGNASGASGAMGVYTEFTMAVTPGQVIAFTCGAKGTGGAAGNNNGTAGGDSTFGSVTAKGGVGGNGSASGNAAGQTTASTVATLNASRSTPTATLFQNLAAFTISGAGVTGLNSVNFGTNNPWAIIPVQGGPNAAGGNGGGYGQGGAGATSTTGGTFAGGDGAPGAIMIVAK